MQVLRVRKRIVDTGVPADSHLSTGNNRVYKHISSDDRYHYYHMEPRNEERDECSILPEHVYRDSMKRMADVYEAARRLEDDQKKRECYQRFVWCVLLTAIVAIGTSLIYYIITNHHSDNTAGASSKDVKLAQPILPRGGVPLEKFWTDAVSKLIDTRSYMNPMYSLPTGPTVNDGVELVDVYLYCELLRMPCTYANELVGMAIYEFNSLYACTYNVRFGLLQPRRQPRGVKRNRSTEEYYYEPTIAGFDRMRAKQLRIVPRVGGVWTINRNESLLKYPRSLVRAPHQPTVRYGYIFPDQVQQDPTVVVETIGNTKDRTVTYYEVPFETVIGRTTLDNIHRIILEGVLMRHASLHNKSNSAASRACDRDRKQEEVLRVEMLLRSDYYYVEGLTEMLGHMRSDILKSYSFLTWVNEQLFANYVKLADIAHNRSQLAQYFRNGESPLTTVQQYKSWLPFGTMVPTRYWQDIAGIGVPKPHYNSTIAFGVPGSSTFMHILVVKEFGKCAFDVDEILPPYPWIKRYFINARSEERGLSFVTSARNVNITLHFLGSVESGVTMQDRVEDQLFAVNYDYIVQVRKENNVTVVKFFDDLDTMLKYVCTLQDDPSDMYLV